MFDDRIMVLDIETRPDPTIQDSQVWWAKQAEGIEPDGRIKDPIKMAASVQEKMEGLKEKSALSPMTGMIATIGWQLWSEDAPTVLVTNELNRQGERELLMRFRDAMPSEMHTLVGWFLKAFDVAFVLGRCMVHDIDLPWWPKPRDYRNVIDLREDLGLGQGLGNWQYVLGGGFKEVDGKDTLTIPLNELAEHNRQDVLTTMLIAHRTKFSWGRRDQ